MAIIPRKSFKMDKINYQAVFIPTTDPDDFNKMANAFFENFELRGHPDGFLSDFHNDGDDYDRVIEKIAGTWCEVSTKIFLKKKEKKEGRNFLELPQAEQQKLEAEYMNNLLKTCQEFANKYHITLYYKACLMFPIEHLGRDTIFINHKITQDN